MAHKGHIDFFRRNFITCDRNLLTCDRILLTCDRNLLTCDRNLITCDRNLLTCDRMLITCDRKLLTCDRNLITCDRNLLTCDRMLITCDRKLLRWLVGYMDMHAYVCVLTLDQWEKMVANYICERFFFTTLFVLLKFSDGWALPDYLPTIRNIDGNHERNYLIVQYFCLGFNYPEIMSFLLLCHGVRLSLRQLKMILRSRGLGRRRNHSRIERVVNAVDQELQSSGSCIGYRKLISCDRKLLSCDEKNIKQLLNHWEADCCHFCDIT